MIGTHPALTGSPRPTVPGFATSDGLGCPVCRAGGAPAGPANAAQRDSAVPHGAGVNGDVLELVATSIATDQDVGPIDLGSRPAIEVAPSLELRTVVDDPRARPGTGAVIAAPALVQPARKGEIPPQEGGLPRPNPGGSVDASGSSTPISPRSGRLASSRVESHRARVVQVFHFHPVLVAFINRPRVPERKGRRNAQLSSQPPKKGRRVGTLGSSQADGLMLSLGQRRRWPGRAPAAARSRAELPRHDTE